MYLGDSIKQIPNNLQHLTLNIDSNNLGDNDESIKNLAKCIKYLPFNLQ